MTLENVLDPLALSRAITAPYDNRPLTQVNDHEVRMGIMTEPYDWHRHPDSDETFLTIDGDLIIEFEEGPIRLAPGQMLTVPRGRLHRTRPAGARSVNLTFEKSGAATEFVDAPTPA